MNKLKTLLLPFLLLVISCGEDTTPADIEKTSNETQIITPTKPSRTKLVANIDYLRLRSEAGTDSETIAMLKEGDVMYDLGEMSDFTTKVELRGIKYNDPWIKVETNEGKQGWIYAGGISFDLNSSSEAVDLLLKKRLTSFYGKETSEDILEYHQAYQRATTDQKFTEVLIQGKTLVDKLNEDNEDILPEPTLRTDPKSPNLSWLDQAVPGYHLGSAAEGTRYWFFRDLKEISEKAKQTRGRADDDFAALRLQMFPRDSMEYFFPVYFMQTWDYGGHSLLGEGKHLEILQSANEMMAKHPGYFDKELDKIKEDLIHDVTAAPGGYWYDKSKILSEIDAIIAAELGILTDNDKIALKEQRKRFENPAVNNLKIGIRSGDVGH